LDVNTSGVSYLWLASLFDECKKGNKVIGVPSFDELVLYGSDISSELGIWA
jgi:hypothetical protein